MFFRSLIGLEESDLSDPQSWLKRLFGGQPTASGESVTSDSAITNSNVYTCANILAGDIGKFPIQTFRKRKSGIEYEESHPVAKLLGSRPNPYMSAYTFKETMQVHCICWGNAYSYIDWDWNGQPKALWILDPSLTDVRLDQVTGELWYVTTTPGGEQRKIPWYDMLHIKMLSKSGLKGISPIAAIRERIGIQQAADKFLGSFYANGTASSGVVKVPVPLKREAKEKVREEWQKLNSGLSNYQKVAVLDGGMDFQNLVMPLKDAEFIQTQKFGISEIAKIYKIPPHKLGQLDKSTYNNVEQQSLDYIKSTIQPIVVNWEEEINYKLFTLQDQKRYYCKFNVTSELRGDSQARAQYYREMISIGVYTVNEVRALEELDRIGDVGDKHYMSLNFTTLDMIEQYQAGRAGLLKGGEKNKNGTDE
ncbi:phage portal protein [Thermoactinomyces sp. DSM 45892]|uniref:phage portal protein n=1 Tax=Thermoactinomyces sp. DSM 45892 TaxID=1882753 RepID=UPI00089707AA|nr:phage portal protein [Thermoactinomyces sp. DSM 45892]SDY84511.1 phage portal protein, HK97 family [Thermoactinomyces sp. DSM 45892]